MHLLNRERHAAAVRLAIWTSSSSLYQVSLHKKRKYQMSHFYFVFSFYHRINSLSRAQILWGFAGNLERTTAATTNVIKVH